MQKGANGMIYVWRNKITRKQKLSTFNSFCDGKKAFSHLSRVKQKEKHKNAFNLKVFLFQGVSLISRIVQLIGEMSQELFIFFIPVKADGRK